MDEPQFDKAIDSQADLKGMVVTMKESKASPYFTEIPMDHIYNRSTGKLTKDDCSERLVAKSGLFLTDAQVLRGIPFSIGIEADKNVLLIKDEKVIMPLESPLVCNYIVVLHGVDFREPKQDKHGFYNDFRGNPILAETAATYILKFADGTQCEIPIRRRYEINEFETSWGEVSFLCQPHKKPCTILANTELLENNIKTQNIGWGKSQTRVSYAESSSDLDHWLFAIENPHPEKQITGIEFIPGEGTVFVFGLTSTSLKEHPLRWSSEKRMLIRQKGLDPELVDIDLGVIINVQRERVYDNANWERGYINQPPEESDTSYLIEYIAHSDALVYYSDMEGQKVNDILESADLFESALQVNEPSIKVNIKTLDKNNAPVPVKLHIHGAGGEYLPPMDRHRRPNPFWFEDYSADFTTNNYFASYISGNTFVMLPIGNVYIEVTKGFEIAPIKKTYQITAETTEIVFNVEHVLPWRQKGWVSADTHVHFLSPQTAQLEGSGEGVNIVNLLASQWGELFTNIGDFDGHTTIGSIENGGDGEFLVRVGTENRQPIMGHISLLGYEGDIILPLTSGGIDEARVGDAVDSSLTLWAEQCRKQNGITVLPHHPHPRAEGAASIILDQIDAVEMTAWDNIFGGISPYSLSDWYRYLSCGFHVPAVGGSDKMSASAPVGGLRTYALIKDAPFTYDSWKASVSSGVTFVTCGPLVDFLVDGKEAGSTITFDKNGGTLDINWQVSSLITTVTKVQIIYNGDVVDEKTIKEEAAALGKNSGIPILERQQIDHYGHFSMFVKESGWIALRVFGQYPEYMVYQSLNNRKECLENKEIVAAHTSAVMIKVAEKPIYDHQDAMSILEQIEGATVFLKTLAPRKDERQFAEILSRLTSAHRKLHNMMHQNHVYHDHTHDYSHHND